MPMDDLGFRLGRPLMRSSDVTSGGLVLALFFGETADPFGEQCHIEWLLEDFVEAKFLKLFRGRFVFASQTDDQCGGVRIVLAEVGGDLHGFASTKTKIDDNGVGVETLCQRTGFESALGEFVFEVIHFRKEFFHPVVEQLLGADEQHFVPFFLFEFSQRHSMLFEESNELFAGDPAILATGDAVAFEPAAVEPFRNGSGGHFTNFCNLTGGKHLFHRGHSIFQRTHGEPPLSRGTAASPRGGTTSRQLSRRPAGGIHSRPFNPDGALDRVPEAEHGFPAATRSQQFHRLTRSTKINLGWRSSQVGEFGEFGRPAVVPVGFAAVVPTHSGTTSANRGTNTVHRPDISVLHDNCVVPIQDRIDERCMRTDWSGCDARPPHSTRAIPHSGVALPRLHFLSDRIRLELLPEEHLVIAITVKVRDLSNLGVTGLEIELSSWKIIR